jgi:hypothetical protein
MNNFSRRASVLAFLCSCCLPLAAQSITGTILGTVFDPSKAVITGAKVKATNIAQGWNQESVTDAFGDYIFTHLPPGEYSITVSTAGFQTVTIPNINLQLDQRARVDATLQAGSVTEQVTVEAGSTPLLATDSNVIGQVEDTRDIRELPLNGRRFFDLALLTSGAAPQGSTFSSVVWGRTTGLSLSGTRDINVSFLIDGAETRDERYGGTFQFSSVESIQEFKVQENFVDAQYGQASAVVSAVTASGTNEFHGALYEFLRNDKLNSRNFFDGKNPPPFRMNQFGASIGGPVELPKYNGKDKTFFFFNYEGQRQRQGSTTLNIVPTAAERTGDLSVISTPIYDPFSGSSSTGLRTPLPNNQIPASRIDPISQKLLAYWPTPNQPGTGANFIVPVQLQNDYDQFTTRIDHDLSSKDRIMGRYSYINEPYFQAGYAPLSGKEAPLRDNGVVVQYTRVVSPRAVNEFRFSYTRSAAGYTQEPVSQNLDAQIGLQNTTTDPREFGLPSVSVTGFTGFGSFSPTISNETDRFQWADDFTYTLGKHNLKMGTDLRRLRYRQRSAQDPRGTLTYSASFTNPGPGLAGGNSLAEFLLGTPSSYQLELEELGFDGRMMQPSFYFQDDFKVTQRLSLTLGTRWEFNSPWVQPRNNAGVFNFSTQQIQYVLQDPFAFRTSTQVGSALSRSIIEPQYNNFADRIGVAYRVGSNTVIRAGHGTYWNNVNNNQLTQSMSLYYPFVYLVSQAVSTSTLTSTITNGTLYPGRPAGNALPYGPSFAMYTVQKTFRRPYTLQWNFNIQHTFKNDYLFEIGYMGNESHKLPSYTNFNQASLPDPNIPFANQPLQARRPYQSYGTISMFDHMGNANYNGLTVKVQKRFSSGFSFLTAYTYSKAIDTGTDISSDPIKAPGDAKSYRGLAALDTGQRFIASYTYELPFGNGKKFGGQSGAFADTLIGGWQLNGITTISLGVPFAVTEASTTPNVDAVYVTANRTCDGLLPRDQRTRLRYFDTSCFAVSAPGTFGNAGRDLWHGPGINNWDLSAFKNFALGSERLKLQFRAETFNLFNHTQFNNPTSSLPNATFGQILSAKAPRVTQLALRLTY